MSRPNTPWHSSRLASLRIAHGVHASCRACEQTITEADLACAVTLDDGDRVHTMNFHHSCYREWTLKQGNSRAVDSTDVELAEGLQR